MTDTRNANNTPNLAVAFAQVMEEAADMIAQGTLEGSKPPPSAARAQEALNSVIAAPLNVIDIRSGGDDEMRGKLLVIFGSLIMTMGQGLTSVGRKVLADAGVPLNALSDKEEVKAEKNQEARP